jgi:hypothetical protein
VHLVDGGRAGRGDRFSITLGTGYASGERPVLGEISVR